MKRNKFGRSYYTLLGGGIDNGETPEQAIVREVWEESSIKVKDPRLVLTEDAPEPFGTEFVFVCRYDGGNAEVHPDSQEAVDNAVGQNTYEPVWIDLGKLADTNLLSTELKRLMSGLKAGFDSGYPKRFSSKTA